MSQRQLATAVGVSGSAVAQWEGGGGGKGITTTNLFKVARVLKLELSDVMGKAEPDSPMVITDPTEQTAIHALRALSPGLRAAHVALMLENIDTRRAADEHSDPSDRRKIAG